VSAWKGVTTLLAYPTQAVKGNPHQVGIDQCRIVVGELAVFERMPKIVEVMLEQQLFARPRT
jgi:hypothetical protein